MDLFDDSQRFIFVELRLRCILERIGSLPRVADVERPNLFIPEVYVHRTSSIVLSSFPTSKTEAYSSIKRCNLSCGAADTAFTLEIRLGKSFDMMPNRCSALQLRRTSSRSDDVAKARTSVSAPWKATRSTTEPEHSMGAPLAALSLFLRLVSTTMPFAVTKSWEITVCSHPVSGNTLNRKGVPISGVMTKFISEVGSASSIVFEQTQTT